MTNWALLTITQAIILNANSWLMSQWPMARLFDCSPQWVPLQQIRRVSTHWSFPFLFLFVFV